MCVYKTTDKGYRKVGKGGREDRQGRIKTVDPPFPFPQVSAASSQQLLLLLCLPPNNNRTERRAELPFSQLCKYDGRAGVRD